MRCFKFCIKDTHINEITVEENICISKNENHFIYKLLIKKIKTHA